jgi:hypothetical protein
MKKEEANAVGVSTHEERNKAMTLELACLVVDLSTFAHTIASLQALPGVITLQASAPERQAKDPTQTPRQSKKASQQ